MICECVVEDVDACELGRHLQVRSGSVIIDGRRNKSSLAPLRRPHAVVQVHNLQRYEPGLELGLGLDLRSVALELFPNSNADGKRWNSLGAYEHDPEFGQREHMQSHFEAHNLLGTAVEFVPVAPPQVPAKQRLARQLANSESYIIRSL